MDSHRPDERVRTELKGVSKTERPPETKRVLFHVHTRLSPDAWLTPRQIVDYAVAHDIGAVIVTDHDTHVGSVACASLSVDGVPYCPVAAEYRSSGGDIIAAFLSRPISTRDPLGIIRETHEQNGLVILPHPFKGSRFSDRVFEEADLIEVFNSRCSDLQNTKAAEVAGALGKPGIAGADAHLPIELGLVLNEYFPAVDFNWAKTILSSPRTALTGKTTKRLIRQSQMLMAIRKARPVLLAKNVVRWMQASPGETP